MMYRGTVETVVSRVVPRILQLREGQSSVQNLHSWEIFPKAKRFIRQFKSNQEAFRSQTTCKSCLQYCFSFRQDLVKGSLDDPSYPACKDPLQNIKE